MKTIAAINGDIDPTFALIDGVVSAEQRVLQRLNFLRGEWFLDTEAGVPYFDDILTKPTTLQLVAQTLEAVILSVPGVLGLSDTDADIDPRTRTFSFSATIQTASGNVGVAI